MTGIIESMNGARFVHDQLELAGWDVEIAHAVKVKGLAPLAASIGSRGLGARTCGPPGGATATAPRSANGLGA